jgi:hypothetical protein
MQQPERSTQTSELRLEVAPLLVEPGSRQDLRDVDTHRREAWRRSSHRHRSYIIATLDYGEDPAMKGRARRALIRRVARRVASTAAAKHSRAGHSEGHFIVGSIDNVALGINNRDLQASRAGRRTTT